MFEIGWPNAERIYRQRDASPVPKRLRETVWRVFKGHGRKLSGSHSVLSTGEIPRKFLFPFRTRLTRLGRRGARAQPSARGPPRGPGRSDNAGCTGKLTARVNRELNLLLCRRGSYGDGYPKLCTLVLAYVNERECGFSSALFRQQPEGGKGCFIFTVGDFSFRGAWLCTVARH
jgi:hypothetical protein